MLILPVQMPKLSARYAVHTTTKTMRISSRVIRSNYMAKYYICHCCGSEFPEPYGVYEKIRCPMCDAVRDDDNDDVIEEVEE